MKTEQQIKQQIEEIEKKFIEQYFYSNMQVTNLNIHPLREAKIRIQTLNWVLGIHKTLVIPKAIKKE